MIFAIVFAFAALDSLPPPTLLAPGKRADTLWMTSANPLRDRVPFDPELFVRVPKAVLPKKKNEP